MLLEWLQKVRDMENDHTSPNREKGFPGLRPCAIKAAYYLVWYPHKPNQSTSITGWASLTGCNGGVWFVVSRVRLPMPTSARKIWLKSGTFSSISSLLEVPGLASWFSQIFKNGETRFSLGALGQLPWKCWQHCWSNCQSRLQLALPGVLHVLGHWA